MLHELPLIFVGGLLGSAHCVGMCGGLALSVGAVAPKWNHNLGRQLTFSAGRITTYATMGTAAGLVGARIGQWFSTTVPIQAILALVAGALVILQGLAAAGIVRRRVASGQHPCLLPRFLAGFLTSPGLANAYMAGALTGLLPCGLVYAFVSLAAATGHPITGWLLMLAFGLGTVPIMVATGMGGSLFTLAARRRTLQIAGWCVVLTGLISIARGVSAFSTVPDANQPAASAIEISPSSPVACPLCPPPN